MNNIDYHIKYPRTYHFDFSDGKTNDDKVQKDLSRLEGKYVIISEKMDGENTTMTNIKYYARSLDSNNHPSRNYVKGIWGNIKHEIPEGFRICGENLYAKHSIEYDNLLDYFLCFSIWEYNRCLSWEDTKKYCEILNIKTVPVIWEGIFDINKIKEIVNVLDIKKQEGFVVRLADEFESDEFCRSVIKYVRKNHVQTNNHWTSEKIIQNKLIKEYEN